MATLTAVRTVKYMGFNSVTTIDIIIGIACVYLWWRQNRMYAKQARSIQEEGLLTRKLSSLKEVEAHYIEFKNPGIWQGNNRARLLSSLDQAKLIFTDKKIVDAITEMSDNNKSQGRWDEVEGIISLMKNDIEKNKGSIQGRLVRDQ